MMEGAMRFMLRKALLTGLFLAVSLAASAEPTTLRAPGGGEVRPLVVGINDYYRMPQAAQLHGAVADANDIAQALRKVGVAVKPLLNREATRTRLVQELDRIVAESRRGDLVVFSFAGHGLQVPEYDAWKGIDPDGVDEEIVLSGFSFSGDGVRDVLVNKELKAYLARLDAKGVDVVVAMDSCFGGGMSRAVDPRSGEWTIRQANGKVAKVDLDKFVPIAMDGREARAVVRAMTHVTFLAGASKDTVVPEIPNLDPNTTRGALSYYFARAIEGAGAQDGDLTRQAIIKYVMQNVSENSAERQRIEFEPRTNDPNALQRVVLHFGERNLEIHTQDAAIPSPVSFPVHLAVIGGTAGAIAKGKAPFELVNAPSAADLVWDVAQQDAIARGDRLLDHVDGSLIGGVIDRTWAIRAIERLAETRVLQIGLTEGGKLYVPGDSPKIIASGVGGAYLTVFNIAATGQVQMLYPPVGGNARLSEDEWRYAPNVTSPFGADQVVAVATSAPPTQLLSWLYEHDQRADAALLPGELKKILDGDASARIGTVGLHTARNR
jgi:hypothetical protein